MVTSGGIMGYERAMETVYGQYGRRLLIYFC